MRIKVVGNITSKNLALLLMKTMAEMKVKEMNGADMITARNYAAQLSEWMGSDMSMYSLEDREIGLLKAMSRSISKAVHFVVPDGAELLSNQGGGLVGAELHLPFRNMTIEWYEPTHKAKNVAIALEIDGKIQITGAFKLLNEKHWTPSLSIMEFTGVESKNLFKCSMGKFIFPSIQKANNMDEGSCRMMTDGYISVLVDLLEALSCRNVTTINHQDASPANAKRIKAGKLPIYETKMLVIDTKATETSNGGCGGSHASPRQHLRRGHIRRHPTAGNLWINSCVVGDPSKGVINKSYAVK